MQLVKSTTNYWTIIEDYDGDYKSDGFWVVFLRRNIGCSDEQKLQFYTRVRNFMIREQIRYAKIALPFYDRMIVCTSCEKNEITAIGRKIVRDFDVDACDVLWKANFESDASWGKDSWQNLLDASFEEYENILYLNNIPYPLEAILKKSKSFQKVLELIIMSRESMVVKPVFNGISYTEDENFVFVLMPFGELWSEDVYHLIKKAGTEAGVLIHRADDFFEPNIIIDDIWTHINRASLVIADISSHNANVFYELGIAHTIGKKVVLIKNKEGQV